MQEPIKAKAPQAVVRLWPSAALAADEMRGEESMANFVSRLIMDYKAGLEFSK